MSTALLAEREPLSRIRGGARKELVAIGKSPSMRGAERHAEEADPDRCAACRRRARGALSVSRLLADTSAASWLCYDCCAMMDAQWRCFVRCDRTGEQGAPAGTLGQHLQAQADGMTQAQAAAWRWFARQSELLCPQRNWDGTARRPEANARPTPAFTLHAPAFTLLASAMAHSTSACTTSCRLYACVTCPLAPRRLPASSFRDRCVRQLTAEDVRGLIAQRKADVAHLYLAPVRRKICRLRGGRRAQPQPADESLSESEAEPNEGELDRSSLAYPPTRFSIIATISGSEGQPVFPPMGIRAFAHLYSLRLGISPSRNHGSCSYGEFA